MKNSWSLLSCTDSQPIRSCDFEWHLNLGLLIPIYERTQNSELKEKVGFLALQYLGRASQINLSDISNNQSKSHQNLYQLGFFQESATYHRSSTIYEPYVEEVMERAFVPQSLNLFILTDTVDFERLLPLYFHTLPLPVNTKLWIQIIADVIEEYMRSHKNGRFFHFLELPILLDLTSLVANVIQTDADEFNRKMKSLEEFLNEAVIQAVKTRLFDVGLEPKKLEAFIRANVMAICRSEVKGVPVVKILPLFHNPDCYAALNNDSEICGSNFSEIFYGHGCYLARFINLTGLRLGAVRARETLFRLLDFNTFLEKSRLLNGSTHKSVTYAPKGLNALYLKSKLDLTRMVLFQKFIDLATKVTPERALLIRAAAQVIEGLLFEIDDQKWDELNQNLETRELLQNFLVRLSHHIARATYEVEDFAHFTTALELIFSEVASILVLTSPFRKDDFSKIYISKLKHIPKNLRPFIKAGVAKSAMHIFAATLTLAPKASGKSKAHTAMMPGIYHEQTSLIKEENTLDQVLENPEIPVVDVFVGEFNPNVNRAASHTIYHARNPIGDVSALLKSKPKTERLTVLLDSTIDFVQSKKAHAFLDYFSKEIEAGLLNILFIRSGQKFDMLGMDNYYGSPFYMIHNNDPYWEPFNALINEASFETDPLSMQWFCLANRYAFEEMEEHRGLIFRNTRSILERIPKELQPGSNPDISISTFEEGIDPCFIDIKLLGDLNVFYQIQKAFFDTFLASKRKVYMKPGFGFLSPNFLPYGSPEGAPRTIRINPGLDPADANLLIDFIKYLNNIY
ncbi:MAG: hypothetical protein JJU12_04510 [Chlamydiales bacterium]|nr:hypothetical protein [Chlamydiales bacterium]